MFDNSFHAESRGPEFHRLLRQDKLILDVTEQFAKAMQDAGLSQADLARKMGRSPSFISKLLSGSRNITLRTIADVSSALSLDVSVSLRDPVTESIGGEN